MGLSHKSRVKASAVSGGNPMASTFSKPLIRKMAQQVHNFPPLGWRNVEIYIKPS
jgi:hypothetical protein